MAETTQELAMRVLEALRDVEGSVTIRHMHTRVQETVLVHELVEYLKKLK